MKIRDALREAWRRWPGEHDQNIALAYVLAWFAIAVVYGIVAYLIGAKR